MYGARSATPRSDGVLHARTSSSPSVVAKRSSAQSSAVASLYRLVQANSAASAWRTPTDRPLSTAATSDDIGTPVLWKWSSVNRAPLWQFTQFALPTNSLRPATSSGVNDDVES